MEGDDIYSVDWALTRNNSSTNFQDFLMSNNHHQPPVDPVSAGNSHPLQPGISPFYPGVNNYPNLEVMDDGVNLSPSFPDALCDFSLETEFSHLSLLNPSHPAPFLAAAAAGAVTASGYGSNGGDGGSLFRNNQLVDFSQGLDYNSYARPQFSYGDLQRMRVLSAVRGHMGLCMQPENYPLSNDHHENLDPDSQNGCHQGGPYGYGWGNYNMYNGGRSFNGYTHQYGSNLIGFGNRSFNGYRTQPGSNLPDVLGYGNYQSFNGYRPQTGSNLPDVIGYGNQGFNGYRPHNGSNLPYEIRHGNQLNLYGNDYRLDPNFQNRAPSLNGINGSNNSSVPLMSRNRSLHPSRLRLNNYSSLEALRGRIFLEAKDQYGCRFLQQKFDEGRQEDIQMIFSEVKDHIYELMVNQFGNYLIQKFLETFNEEQMTQLVLLVIKDDQTLLTVCLDSHGTRAVQKLIESITTQDQISLVISVLRRITVPLVNSSSGCHVIQHCLKFFSHEDYKHLLNEVSDNCVEIATDKSGCCVLQTCVDKAHGETLDRLLREITLNAIVLSENPFGNYVVQHILGKKIIHVAGEIIVQFRGKVASLSMNKYASNVVEKCMKDSTGNQAIPMVKEIMNSPNFLMILQDPFGNYVAQSALGISKGALRHTLVNMILVHYPYLHSHPHGKKVLEATKAIRSRA